MADPQCRHGTYYWNCTDGCWPGRADTIFKLSHWRAEWEKAKREAISADGLGKVDPDTRSAPTQGAVARQMAQDER